MMTRFRMVLPSREVTRNDVTKVSFGQLDDMTKEIADLKASNERLADALAAAKVRAGDTWGM